MGLIRTSGMRNAIVVAGLWALTAASALHAQPRPPRERPIIPYSLAPAMANDLAAYTGQLQSVSIAVRREAFIVAQLVAAAGASE